MNYTVEKEKSAMKRLANTRERDLKKKTDFQLDRVCVCLFLFLVFKVKCAWLASKDTE